MLSWNDGNEYQQYKDLLFDLKNYLAKNDVISYELYIILNDKLKNIRMINSYEYKNRLNTKINELSDFFSKINYHYKTHPIFGIRDKSSLFTFKINFYLINDNFIEISFRKFINHSCSSWSVYRNIGEPKIYFEDSVYNQEFEETIYRNQENIIEVFDILEDAHDYINDQAIKKAESIFEFSNDFFEIQLSYNRFGEVIIKIKFVNNDNIKTRRYLVKESIQEFLDM